MARHLHPGTLITAGLSTSLLLAAAPALAEVIEIGPADDLIAAASALQPGDELVLRGGTYNVSAKLTIGVSGTAQAPIVIRAKDGEVPIITRPDANQNTVNIENNEYLVLRGLEVVGGSHGIRLDHARFITIEACHIHDTGDVGISANFPGSSYEGLRLLRNHIHDTNNTGEGMYLGCNSNGCQMFDSLIEGNWIHHTNGPTVVQGDGIEIKEGSYNNVVRDNVIHDTRYPCILTYATVGNGAPNVIERNVLWGCGDHGIQSAADAIIRNNIILGAAGDGIRSQPHQSGAPSGLEIVHNTILNGQGGALRATGVVGPVLIANNALYAPGGNALDVSGDLAALIAAGNVGIGGAVGVGGGFDAGGEAGTDFVGASFSGAPPNDVFPASGSALIGAGDAQYVTADDFNGTARGGEADVGAYHFDAAGNPGWPLGEGFKDPPDGSGGGGGAGSGAGGGGGEAAGTGGGTGGTGAGGGGNGAEPGDEGGCGCRAAGAGEGAGGAGLAAAAAAIAAVMRRRRGDGPAPGRG